LPVPSLPEVSEDLLLTNDKASWQGVKKAFASDPTRLRPAQAETINVAFVNSLVKEAIKMLSPYYDFVTIRFIQADGKKVFSVNDLMHETGIVDGTHRDVDGHHVLWNLIDGELVGKVYR
jgi:hypothetical protein